MITMLYYMTKYGIAIMPVVSSATGERVMPPNWFAKYKDGVGGYGRTPYQAVRECVKDIKRYQREPQSDEGK